MPSFFSGLFGKTPEEQAKEWIRNLRHEQRQIDSQIVKIQREQNKVKVAMKQAAKKDDGSVRILAVEMVRSKKAVSRMYAAKAQMNSVAMELQHQLARMKMVGAMEKSAEVMHAMNELIKVPEVNKNMCELSKEMTKAGIMEEMVNDTLDDTLDADISDSELEEEVNKVVEEVTLQQVGHANPSTKIHGGSHRVEEGATSQGIGLM